MVDVQFQKQRIPDFFWLLGLVLLGLLVATAQPVKGQTAQPPDTCAMPFQPVAVPLTELGTAEDVRMDGTPTGFEGGLYPDGRNVRPSLHEEAGLNISRQIHPLSKEGRLDEENGRILLISIGMSNTATEFAAFTRLAQQKAEINPRLVLINGALPNQIAERWANPEGIAWQELDRKITGYGFSSQQVQVAWVKLTNTGGGEFPQKALALEADLQKVIQLLKERFPNLRLVFLSSRTRSYTYWRGLSPEPLAYETGFAVKWLIEKQIRGDPELNFDPERGEVKAAYLSWGPYLWSDGENPREDGFLWLASDLTKDCTHPSSSGAEKVARQLWEFFSTDTITRDWFLFPTTASSPTAVEEIFISTPVSRATSSNTPPVPTKITTPVPQNTPASLGMTSSPEPAGEEVNSTKSAFPTGLGVTLLLALVGISVVWGWLQARKKD